MSKSDRRKWNKSTKEFNLDYPDTSEDIIRKRYDEYLLNLHLQNQFSKHVSEKNPKELELEQKETGFNVYVNGAHKGPERFTPRYTITNTRNRYNNKNNIPITFVPKLHIRKQHDSFDENNDENRCKSAPSNKRKQWGNSSITIKTMDGVNIKLCAPVKSHSSANSTNNLKSEDYYSDDFETDSEEDKNVNTFQFNINKNSESKIDEKNLHKEPAEIGDLIKSVKFSDESSSASTLSTDDELEKIKKNNNHNKNKDQNKKCLKLSRADIKFLRESIVTLDTRLSDDSLEEEIEIDCKRYEKKIQNQIQNVNKQFGNLKQISPSKKCNMILDAVENLNHNGRKNLLKFLKSVDGLTDLASNEGNG